MIKFYFFGKKNQINKTSFSLSALQDGLEELDFACQFPPIFVDQIHGNEVLIIDDLSKIPQQNPFHSADAIVTNLKKVPIGIITADCAPIFLFDEESEVIGAIHAGWQGAFKDIVSNAVDSMLEIGAQLKNIKAVIGPMIDQDSYEVDQNFYKKFLTNNLGNGEFFIASEKNNHYFFDLPSYIKEKLRNAGVSNIFDEKIDTYENYQMFCSYRKNTHLGIKDDENRNVSVIEIV